METITVKKVAPVSTSAPAAVKKPAPASTKGMVEKKLKAAAKTTDSVCAEITKKILTNKKAAEWDVTEIGGVSKDEMMKLVEILDGMGTATYNTACALRELQQRMK